jgi:hypothetical protein
MSARLVFRQRWLAEVLALGVLGGVAWAIAGVIIRDDVFIYGDHAGHYWTLWYTLNIAVPQHQRLIDWIPYWYAGYPERLFYPPGSMIVGWILNLLTLGKFSTALIYESIVFLAYALPAFTFYYALRRFGFQRNAAFAAGVMVLGFPAFFDGAPAAIIGMVGSRLSFGLNALVFVWTIEFLETRRWRCAWFAVTTLALAIPLHPYHALGLTFGFGLYALARRLSLTRAVAQIGIVVLAALALDAFWLVPLFAHSSGAMIPHIRATFDQIWRLLTDATLLPYVFLALIAVMRARRELDVARRAILIVLIVLPILLTAIMLVWSGFVVARLHFYQLDPVRLIGEIYFMLILLAALGLAHLSDWLARFAPPRIRTWFASSIAVAVSIGLLIPFAQSSAHFARADGEPRFLRQAIAEYRLDELWATLRQTPGRVWFTSFYTRLNKRGIETFPTTITALTPLFTDRQIIGGTFSHWSPIGAFVWTGKSDPPVLWGLPEDQDDRALFGVPLEKLDDADVYDYCRRFNITTIVASINDFHTRTFLDASPHFQSYYNNGYFFVYRVNDYENAWFDARHANVELLSFDDTEIVLRVHTAQADASVNFKVYAYPLWRARTDAGQSLSIQRDDLAMMQIALPPGENYTVTLRYEDGIAEQIGSLVSILGGTILVSGMLFARWRKNW